MTMTPEAQKFIRNLIKKNPSCCYECIQEGNQIVSVKLKHTALTAEQFSLAIHYASYGNPTILVEWRPEDDPRAENGISAPFIFLDEANELPEEIHKNFDVKAVVIPLDWITSSVPLSSMSKGRLIEELLEAEKNEMYERCAEIIKMAAAKGWELKKEL